MTGAFAAGRVMLLSFALVVTGVSLAIVATDTVTLLYMVTSPDLILLLVGINVIVGFIRILAVTDAWHRGGGRAIGLGLIGLLVFTAIPHVAIGYVGLETRATILAVFPSSGSISAAPLATTTTKPEVITTTTTTLQEPLVPAWQIPIATVTTSPPTTTTTIPLGAQRLTFLLLGGDAGVGRPGLRTDSMMVATVDTVSGQAAVFGLPRNMAGFRFSDGSIFEGTSRGILNEVYMWGQRNPERFGGPEPGIAALKDVAETTLGLAIDHYVLVDMAGFADLVDAMGGVTVNVSRPISAPLYDAVTGEHVTIIFEPGRQHLDGDLALAYSRSRTNSNDYDRMARQRCVVTALVDQAGPLTMARSFGAILNVFEKSVTTDIPSSRLPYLLNFAPTVSTEQMTVVGFDREYRSGEKTAAGYAIPDFEKIQAVVGQVTDGTWESGSHGLATATEACA